MRQRALSLAVAVVVGVALVSASGAAITKSQNATKIDVSTRAAVIQYLRSIHVSVRGVVIQRGLRNYAGASCPGKGWTCASTRHTVVQIAKRGGLNRFACGTARCAVVQIGSAARGLKAASPSNPKPPPPNYALCVKTTGVTQSCVINQPNASGQNKAVVWMVTPKLTGLTQSSNYSASITQGPPSPTGSNNNNNLACVRQFVWLDGSTTKTNATSTVVTNDNHESIFIQQNSLSGSNEVRGAVPPSNTNPNYDCGGSGSQLTQDEQLTSTVTSKGSITQKQNTATTGFANVVTDIEQNQDINGFSGFNGNATGLNTANFKQTTTQVAIANTPNGTVNQTQGANVPNPPYSGLVGTINQDSTGISTASATQTESQCEDAVNTTLPAPPPAPNPPVCPVLDGAGHDVGPPPGLTQLTQTQFGPEGILSAPTHSQGRVHYAHKGYGQSVQTGNSGDSFTIGQTSTQSTDSGSSQTNTVQADCQSSGNCSGTQGVTNNNGTTNNGNSGGGGGKVTFSTDCTTTCTPTANFPGGNVFVSIGDGKVEEWNPHASGGPALVRTFDTTKGAGVFTTGLAFDANKNLYVTDFFANDVTKFNSDGSLAGSFGSGYGANPESIVFDSSGNAFVGQAGDTEGGAADGTQNVLKFSSAGNLLTTFTPAIEDRGTDWIDLSSDASTLYYTSEGTTVKTFDLVGNTQGTDFATGLPGLHAYAIKLLPGGGALVADSDSIVQLNSSGSVVQQYGTGESNVGEWFSLALDPSGGSFWAGDADTGAVKQFSLSCSTNPCNTPLASFTTGGTLAGGAADGLAVAP